MKQICRDLCPFEIAGVYARCSLASNGHQKHRGYAKDLPISWASTVQTADPIRIESWFPIGRRLIGYVYNRPGFINGAQIITSLIVSMDQEHVMTQSGTQYALGQPDPSFLSKMVDVYGLPKEPLW